MINTMDIKRKRVVGNEIGFYYKTYAQRTEYSQPYTMNARERTTLKESVL